MNAETEVSLVSPPADHLYTKVNKLYQNTSLVSAILTNGGIPDNPVDAKIGVGFADIADYSSLSKILSSTESQAVLEGLFTALNTVLENRNGYLNKIQGDSLMFHFGGPLDPRILEMKSEQEVRIYLAKQIFYTCIEIQEVATQFDQVDPVLLSSGMNQAAQNVIRKAYRVIEETRKLTQEMKDTGFTFHISVRVGASVGNVIIGNFGPEGAIQWDVIGNPIIEAKRMETKSRKREIRISKKMYDILENGGIVEEYYNQFKTKAQEIDGHLRGVTRQDLFRYEWVIFPEKNNAFFESYSVYALADLPERIIDHLNVLFSKGKKGRESIIGVINDYRKDRYVIEAIEEVFRAREIAIRKARILESIDFKKYLDVFNQCNGEEVKIVESIENTFSLYDLLNMLGDIEEKIMGDEIRLQQKRHTILEEDDEDIAISLIKKYSDQCEKYYILRSHYENYILPLVLTHVKMGIFDSQSRDVEYLHTA